MTIGDMASVLIEGVTKHIPNLWLTDDTLAAQFNNTRSDLVGDRAFRIIAQSSIPGDSGYVSLDGGVLPDGSDIGLLSGSVIPTVIAGATNWTELVNIQSEAGDKVAVMNVVTRAVNGVVEMAKQMTDALLQTDNKGGMGIIDTAGVNTGTKTITLNATSSFGARLLQEGQTVDIVDPATDISRGTIKIKNRFQFLGGQQQVTYAGANVAGATDADIIRYTGLTDGAPQAINGLKGMVNLSTTGNLHGIPKSNPYVQANGFDNGGAQITVPALALAKWQRMQRLSGAALKGSFWWTHFSQYESYRELGYDKQTIPLADGKAKGMDLFFSGAVTIDGDPVKYSPNAAQDIWYLLQANGFGRVKYKDAYWVKINNQKIYNYYDASTGRPKLKYGSTYVIPTQFYCDTVPAQAVITNNASPAGHRYGL